MAKTEADWRSMPVAVFSDPIFFHKSNVKVGTRFRNVGRLTPNTTWVVQAIWTTSKGPLGITRHYVASVRTLQDRLELRCEENGEVKLLVFGGISYSAIWRLDEPAKAPELKKPEVREPDKAIRPIYKPKPHHTPTITRSAKPRKKLTKEEREERKHKLEAARLIDDLPLAEWAKNIIGDKRISEITLQHILDGIDNYFGIFDQLRRIDYGAYKYFSKVGTPIILEGTYVFEDYLNIPQLPDTSVLPSFVGAFFPRDKEEYRKDILEDRPALMELNYFHKAKNLATVASHGSTIYLHHLVSLKHSDTAFSKEELKKFPYANRNYGVWFPIGITPEGVIKALPCHMQHKQHLPRGGIVHHSSFEIPQGVTELGGHEFARRIFLATVACTATAISGLQVIINKGKTSARFGIPVKNAKEFFADRDPELTDSGRRKSIMHLRLPHHRILQNGKIIRVGEHLRGERKFSWRGYDISVGVPGIHYPSPEGLKAELYIDPKSDPDARPIEDLDDKDMTLIGTGRAFKKYEKIIQSGKKVPFRRGQPTSTYKTSVLPKPDKE